MLNNDILINQWQTCVKRDKKYKYDRTLRLYKRLLKIQRTRKYRKPMFQNIDDLPINARHLKCYLKQNKIRYCALRQRMKNN